MKISKICPEFAKIYIYKTIFYTYKFIRPKNFIYLKNKIRYESSFYNVSFINERSIEIPLTKFLLKDLKPKKVLEIGNVLEHYDSNLERDIVDKYEIDKGVINQDIEYFKPNKKYDLIISISTLEHVGFDEGEKNLDLEKFERCISHIVENLLEKNGTFIITLPVNYNYHVSSFIYNSNLFQEKFFMKKTNLILNTWKMVSFEDLEKKIRETPFLIEEVFFGILKK